MKRLHSELIPEESCDDQIYESGHDLEESLCEKCYGVLTMEEHPHLATPCVTPSVCNEILKLYVTHIQQYLVHNK